MQAILVVGDVMTDVIVRPEGPLVRGSDRRAEIRSRPGGSGANQAVWLGAQGARVRFAARVGADDVPRLEAHFARFGVEARLAADPALPSGVLVTLLDVDGERSFLTDRGANLALGPADLPDDLLDEAGLLLVSGYSYFAPGPRGAIVDLAARARARGLALAVDPASVGFLREVGPADFLAWTSGAGLVFANGEEAECLTGTADLAEQMRRLGSHYRDVIVKLGARGAALGDAAGLRLALPAPSVPVLDTTGAGDAFAAGFLTTRLRGGDDHACLAAGIAAGSRAVQQVGGQPG